MKKLYVLYDIECHLCGRISHWLSRQPAYVELQFIPLQSPEVTCRFPGIEQFQPGEQLVVVSDEGAVYQGSHAWIMCLYALREYREWSLRLAYPALLPFARRACELVSANRHALSRWVKKENAELAEAFVTQPTDDCGRSTFAGLLARKSDVKI